MTTNSNVIQFQPRPQRPEFRRPRLLVQAARAGLSSWNRKRDMRRLFKSDEIPLPGHTLPRLHAEEQRLDMARRGSEADYDVQRHILLLVAIIAETLDSTAAPVTYPAKATQARP